MNTETAMVLPFPRRREQLEQESARAHVRLVPTRRGRMLVTAVAFLLGLLVAAAALLVLDLPSALAGAEPEGPAVVTVEAGDTLWGYAEQYAPEGMSEQEFVTEARTLNHLTTGRITAGQQIELPEAADLTR